VLWAKWLMPEEEAVQDRHQEPSTQEDKIMTEATLLAGLDDTGAQKVPSGLVYHVDGRIVPAAAGHICFTKPHGLIWATAPGTVRSNRLP